MIVVNCSKKQSFFICKNFVEPHKNFVNPRLVDKLVLNCG